MNGSSTSRDLFTWLGLLLMAVCFAYAWNAFWLAPLRLLVVLFHELGHATAATLTGGEVVRIALDVYGAGRTEFTGGSPLVVLNAGYLGSLLAGLGLLRAAEGPARVACVALGAALIVCVAWMPFSLGLVYTGVVGFAFVALGWSAPPAACAWMLRGIGVFSVGYALIDARDDAGRGDAALLAAQTGLPAAIWTALWLVLGVVLVALAARRAVRRRALPMGARGPSGSANLST